MAHINNISTLMAHTGLRAAGDAGEARLCHQSIRGMETPSGTYYYVIFYVVGANFDVAVWMLSLLLAYWCN
jgi:hypothetical protein